MVGYLGQELPIFVIRIQLSSRGGIMGQEATPRPRIQVALQDALVPSIADKRNSLAHHQNTAGMFGSLLSFQNKQV